MESPASRKRQFFHRFFLSFFLLQTHCFTILQSLKPGPLSLLCFSRICSMETVIVPQAAVGAVAAPAGAALISVPHSAAVLPLPAPRPTDTAPSPAKFTLPPKVAAAPLAGSPPQLPHVRIGAPVSPAVAAIPPRSARGAFLVATACVFVGVMLHARFNGGVVVPGPTRLGKKGQPIEVK